MKRSRKTGRGLAGLVATLGATLLLLATAASASAAAEWRLDSLSDTFAEPGGTHRYLVHLANIGDEEADGTGGDPIVLSAELPEGVTAQSIAVSVIGAGDFDWSLLGWDCTGDGPGGPPGIEGAQSVSCEITDTILSRRTALAGIGLPAIVAIDANVASGLSGPVVASFNLSGAGVAAAASLAEVAQVTDDEPLFGLESFDVRHTDAGGEPFSQAAAHPFVLDTTIDFNAAATDRLLAGQGYPIEPLRDVFVDLPPGFVGDAAGIQRCGLTDLLGTDATFFNPTCPQASQVGTVVLRLPTSQALVTGPRPVFNLEPPPGLPARFGFNVSGSVVFLDARLRSDSDYGITIETPAISEGLAPAGTTLTMWGTPGDPRHESRRACPGQEPPGFVEPGPSCSSEGAEAPFLRMPTSCTAPDEGLPWSVAVDSWSNPGALLANGRPDLSDAAWDGAEIESHQAPGYPLPQSEWGQPKGIENCGDVPVKGSLEAQPTSIDTETATGLVVRVEVPNPGLTNPTGISSSDLSRVEVTLPQGMTINPSQAEGLGVCSPTQYESTELSFYPSVKGCPSDSKIGTVSVKTPLLEETIPGNVYVAKPFDNPFDSLLAIYVVLEEPQRGILVKLAGEVETDGTSGRIVTTFDDLPQLPFSSFDFRFREGARAPLVTPPACGTYETLAEFTGWSAPGKSITSTSSFQITRGIGGGPCPAGGTPGFKPGFSAGSVNNNAGSFSPVNMRLTRNDGEQDLTKFSAVLPEGLLAKLAGVQRCSDAAIAGAEAKSGLQEKAGPSCPAASEIGRTLVGAGVGSVLTYVPGKLYLAGPYNGAPLSVVSITPAVAGPFDVGTVAVRVALRVDPLTGVASVDGGASDPIPHILKGIPLKVRDVRVYVDRPGFTLNPTSCDQTEIGATLWGSAADVFDPADDAPVNLSDRFQAAGCGSLGFKPALKINLKGGSKRGDNPALRAVLRPRPGDANLSGAVVKLPRSAFLDQAHIRTICTRVQFAAEACPKAAIYGRVTAWSPLLDEPLKGPAYLRSSDNQLPDLVFDLKGLVDIETSARIDSVRGGIRATFPRVPDAPISRVIVRMQGGRKGLIVNSRDLCAGKSRANVQLDGHNGKVNDFRPLVRPRCGAQRKAKRAAPR